MERGTKDGNALNGTNGTNGGVEHGDDSIKRRKMSEDDSFGAPPFVSSVSAPAAPMSAPVGGVDSSGGAEDGTSNESSVSTKGGVSASSSSASSSSSSSSSGSMSSSISTTTRMTQSVNEIYEMHDELGRGAFSIVYKATHRQSGDTVAIKVIQLGNFSQQERKRQERILDNEIKIMEKIRKDCETRNLIEIRDVVREPNRLAIVMEVLEGKELFDRIVQRQKYTERDAAQLMNTIMQAIKSLHGAGIIHRDLKPENLVFQSEAEDAPVKITDFGLAMVTDWEDVHSTVVGTPNYVAPEVVSIQPRGPFYMTKNDVWSMGVILYILLCGYPPFYHENVRELFKQIRRGDYEFHRDQWAGISDEAKDLVQKMLCVDPQARLSVDDVLRHPWMLNAPNSELKSTQAELKRLNAKRRFKAAAMAVVWGAQLGLRRKLLNLVDKSSANVFNLDELQRIRTSFQLHATNNHMDRDAFHSTMKKLGFEDVPIDRMFDLFDANGDNCIDYKEFLGSLATLRESGEDALRLCFKIYDENNSGRINKNDIGKVLRVMLRVDNESLAAKLEHIFQRLDTNNDGEISYDEFKAGIFSEPVLVQSFLQPLDNLSALPMEHFASTDIGRGLIDPRYIMS